jgi:hypothetical protein
VSATEDVIDDAITAYMRARGWAGVVTGWVVLAAAVDHDGDDERSGVVMIYPNGSMPWHTALGIVEAGRIQIHAAFASGEP